MLQGEGDLLLLLVHVQDVDLELLIDVDHLVGVVDPAPAHVGDVQQAVDAAEVHKGAELGDVLDDALADLADGDLVEQLLLHLLALVLEQLAAGDDDVAAGLVDLEDLALDGAVDVVGDVRRPADVHLAGRQEDVDADVDQKPALDLAGDQALDDVALLVLGDDGLPLGLALGLAVGQDDGAALVLDGVEQHLDFAADLGRLDLVLALVVPLLEGDDAFGLVADVHDHVVADDVDDAALDDLVDLEVLLLRRQPADQVVVEGALQLLVQLLLGQVILAEQIAVDHA